MMLRLKMAWAIMRGRSVAYRIDVFTHQDGKGIGPRTPGSYIVECSVD